MHLCDEQATQQAILEWLRDNLPVKTGPNDRVVFFFAGHGVTHPRSGRGYLVPYGARQGKYSDYVDKEPVRFLREHRQMGKAYPGLLLLSGPRVYTGGSSSYTSITAARRTPWPLTTVPCWVK